MRLEEALRLEDLRPGPLEGRIPPDWGQGRAAFGGLLGALAVRAGRLGLTDERPLRSMSLSFVGPAGEGPLQLHPRVLRDGRSLTHVEVRLEQEGAVCAVALLAFGALRESAIALPSAPPPAVPPPDACAEVPFLPGLTPEFTRHFAYRWTVDTLPFSGAQDPRVQGWVRPRDPGAVDEAALVALLDAWPPPVWSALDRPAPGSSVSWHVSVADAFQPEAEATSAWWLYDARPTFAGHGYSDFEARLWDAGGRLVACSRQLFSDFARPGG